MRFWLVLAGFSVCGCNMAFAGEPVSAAGNHDRAVAAVSAFGGELKEALVSALSSAGPVAAIDVCRVEAPAIAARVSAASGFRVSRTTDRARNSGNAAQAWQAVVLREWAMQQAAGANLAELEFFEQRSGGDFRYMKPIIAQPMCLTCHGESVAPEIQAELGSLYPDDQAIGYQAGDLRGAFVVEKMRE